MATRQLAKEAPAEHLTKIAQAYVPPNNVYVADILLPIVGVGAINFTYNSFESKYFGQLEDNQRAPGAPSGALPWDITLNSDITVEYARHVPIDDRQRKLFGQANLEVTLTKMLAAHMKIQREKRAATLIEATGSYASSSHYTTLSGTSQWSDFTNSDPESDIETGKQQVLTATGVPANTIHIPWNVAAKLKQHPTVREIVRYAAEHDAFEGGPRNGLPEVLWDLNVVVSRATYNSANPGQTQSNDFIWSKYVWIGYVNPNPSALEQSFGYNFEAQTLQIATGRGEYLQHSDLVEATEDCLAKIIASAAGYLIIDAIA